MKIRQRIILWNLTEDLEDALWLSHWDEETAWHKLVEIAVRAAKETSSGKKP